VGDVHKQLVVCMCYAGTQLHVSGSHVKLLQYRPSSKPHTAFLHGALWTLLAPRPASRYVLPGAVHHLSCKSMPSCAPRCLQDLAQAGGELPDAVVERLWNIIQALDPSSKAARGGGSNEAEFRPHPKARPGAAIPGLALQNTREYAKQLDHILLEEADKHKQEKPAAAAAAAAPAAAAGGEQCRNGAAEAAGGGSSRDKGRDRDRERDRSRERRRDRDGDRRRRYAHHVLVMCVGFAAVQSEVVSLRAAVVRINRLPALEQSCLQGGGT
jgi:ribosomal protein L12E/L44/L45/RPP1/RPP2